MKHLRKWTLPLAGAVALFHASLPSAAWANAASAAPPAAASPAAVSTFAPSVYKTFEEWKAACARLPMNRALGRGIPPRNLLPLTRFADFEEALDAFARLHVTGDLSQTNLWAGKGPSRTTFLNPQKSYFARGEIPFEPFTQKVVVPPDTEVLFHGDFHGDIHSLIVWLSWLNQQGYLDGFKIKRPDVRMVFLGDYTDRGNYGVEVLYTIFRLKLENPQAVHLARGNHEELTLATNYGFLAEAQRKFGREFKAEKVIRAYDFLPVVIYLGSGNDFIQCNHGGMEPGYDPRSLLAAEGDLRFQFLGPLKQASFLQANPSWLEQDPPAKSTARAYFQDFDPASPISPSTLGFMWNDFSVVRGESQLRYDAGRAFVYGDQATRYLLAKASDGPRQVRAVFRAHQHSGILNPMMRRLKAGRGVFRHWQATDALNFLNANETALAGKIEAQENRSIPEGSVWTFNVSPDSVYGEGCDFGFDSFGILKTKAEFKDWLLRVVNLPVVR